MIVAVNEVSNELELAFGIRSWQINLWTELKWYTYIDMKVYSPVAPDILNKLAWWKYDQ